jgi:hypothetical protein
MITAAVLLGFAVGVLVGIGLENWARGDNRRRRDRNSTWFR